MVDQIAVVTTTIPSGATTADFTDPSITETFSAALFFATSTDTDDADNTHGIICIGMMAPDTGNSPSVVNYGRTSQALSTGAVTVEARNKNISNGVIVGDTSVASVATRFAYSSSISGGVRVSVSVAAKDVKITAVLFAGFARATCVATATVGSVSVGGSSTYEPDLLITTTPHSTSAIGVDPAPVDNGLTSIGFAVNDIGLTQVSAYNDVDRGTNPSDADGYISSDSFRCNLGSSRTPANTGQVTAFTATGYTHALDTGSMNSQTLALKFSGQFQVSCANIAVAASTGEQTFTDFGFTPDVVIGQLTTLAAVDTLEDGSPGSSSGYFVTGSHGERAHTWYYEEGVTASTANSGHRQEDSGPTTYDDTGTIVLRSTWAGAASGGFKLNFSVASATGFMTALGIQLEQNPLVTSETVAVSDATTLLLSETLVADTEPVLIADSATTTTMDGTMTGPDSVNTVRGWTDQGGSQVGKTEIGGPAELGGS